jgi:hypothetical protein
MMQSRVFLLSPASCSGRRAQLLLRAAAAFPLAVQLRTDGAPLGEVFTFVSGLYFRGKVAYAEAFAQPPAGVPAALVITSSRGLVPLDTTVGVRDLREFARVPIGSDSQRYRRALERTASNLQGVVAADTQVVLLGSIASGKYADILLHIFGPRLRFPAAFVGRGDMSRGGLMLRCADDAAELEYVPLDGHERHGSRPPRLVPRPRRTAR